MEGPIVATEGPAIGTEGPFNFRTCSSLKNGPPNSFNCRGLAPSPKTGPI